MKKGMKYEENMVSVITPMHNAERFVAETIQSVLAQGYRNWEMLLIDDCSTDAGAEIAQGFAAKDARIRYIRNATQQGAAKSRNRGIRLARGRYLAFLDSDDLWKRDKLEKQLAFMQRTGTAFCYSCCEVIDGEGRPAGRVRMAPRRTGYRDLLKGNCIPCLTVVLDRAKIHPIRMPSVPHEDYALWLSILRRGGEARGMQEILASYRVGGNSLSSNKLRSLRWTWNIYRKYLRFGFRKSFCCFCGYLWNAVKKRV